MSNSNAVLAPIPGPLAAWLAERGFDVCPWLRAPVTARKVIGRDAWRFGKVVLARIPVGTDDEVRYYVAICPGPSQGRSIGYWLEVRQLPIVRGEVVEAHTRF